MMMTGCLCQSKLICPQSYNICSLVMAESLRWSRLVCTSTRQSDEPKCPDIHGMLYVMKRLGAELRIGCHYDYIWCDFRIDLSHQDFTLLSNISFCYLRFQIKVNISVVVVWTRFLFGDTTVVLVVFPNSLWEWQIFEILKIEPNQNKLG